MNTPMTAEDYKDDDSKKTDFQRRELTVAEAKLYRRGTALCVYISQDRGDISAATCQLATRMATPTEYDWERLKRVCRYLKGSPRFKYVYHWQATDDVKLRLLTDSDWANEARSRKSHSGGALLAGGHLLQHWCRRQPVVALSSGEAEVYSAVCGLSRLIGPLSLPPPRRRASAPPRLCASAPPRLRASAPPRLRAFSPPHLSCVQRVGRGRGRAGGWVFLN